MPFNGQIAPIFVGRFGLSGSANQTDLTVGHLIEATNITYEGGTVQKEHGAVKYNASAIGGGTPETIIAGYDYFPSPGVQRMIVATDAGKIMRDTGAGTFPTTLKTGLTIGNNVDFVEGGAEVAANDKKLFIFTGVNVVQIVDADAVVTNDIGANKPADWSGSNQPQWGAVHENLMWGGGNTNDPHRVYYSTPTDHEDFTTSPAGSISVYPGEGDLITGAVSFKGFLVVFKSPRGIYLIDTSDGTAANWRVVPLTKDIGCPTQAVIEPIEDDIMFMDTQGRLQILSSIQATGGFGTDSISDRNDLNKFMRDNLSWGGNPKKARLIYFPHKRQAHLVAHGSGSNVNNRRMVFDMADPNLRASFIDRDNPVALWVRDVGGIKTPVIGDDAGFVWDIEQETRDFEGAAYTARFQTPELDLSEIDPALGIVNKNGAFLEVVMEPTGNFSLSANIFWDGELTDSVQFNMGTVGVALGTFVLGTDVLGAAPTLNRKRRIVGSGRRISIQFSNAELGANFSLARAYLHFTVGDERLLK